MTRSRGTLCLLATVWMALCPVVAAKPAPPPAEILTLDVASRGELALLARTGSLVTVDISDPLRPVELGRLSFPATAHSVTLDGDRAWVAAGRYGILIVDISDPLEPRLIHRVNPEGSAHHVLPLDGESLLVAGERDGLSLIDISTPERPRRRVSIRTRDKVRRLARHDGLVASAEGKGGVRLFDFSKASAPHELAWIDTEAPALDVALDGDTLWIVAGKRGLLKFDVSRPRAPLAVAELAPPRTAQSLLVWGERILVACGDAGIQIAESTSDGLVESGRVRLSQDFPALRISASGSLIAVATHRGGLALVELDDPAAPVVRFPRERRMQIKF